MTATRTACIVGLAALGLGACSGLQDVQALIESGQESKRNEYRTVRTQPLVVPKGYELRAPREGGADLRRARSTAVQARRTITGKTTEAKASSVPAGTAEKALIERARKGRVAANR